MKLDKGNGRSTILSPNMKTTIIALAAMAAPLVMAQEAAPAAPAAPAPAPAAEAPAAPAAETPAVDPAEYAKYQAPARETINAMKEIMEVLKGISNKETADAAAPKVKELVQKMDTLKSASEGLAEPSEAIQAKLKAEFEGELMGILSGMQQAFLPVVMQQCYGSSALMEALAPMLGGAMEEQEEPAEQPAAQPAA